jgi:hypothetical protein
LYRIGLGEKEIAQQPREDIAGYRDFDIEVVEVNDNVVTLAIKLPEPARKGGYSLLIRGPQGHLRAELTDADIVDRPAEGVVRYRWERKPTEKPNERTFGVQLFHGLHQATGTITLPGPAATQPK